MADDSILSDSHFDEDQTIGEDDQDLLPDETFDNDSPTNNRNKGNTAPNPIGRFVSSVIDQETRDEGLRQELAHVRKLTQLIAGVTETLEGAMANMATVSNAVTSANTLLDTYIRVLSQSTHNSRLILNGSWQGSSADLASTEAESHNKVQEAHRRQQEAAERAAAAAAAEREREERAREQARREKEGETGGKRGSSSRGRKTPGSRSASAQGGSGYGQQVSSTGLPTPASSRGIPRGRYTSRVASGIGRGTGRGTGRAAK